MGQAAGAIAARLQARLLVLGGPQEGSWVVAVADAARAAKPSVAVEAAADFTVEQTAALLARCRLVLANNSGPLHLAAALGVPTVSTLGPTHPQRFSPRAAGGAAAHAVVRLGVSCSPCNLGWCSHHTCLKAITVERLLAAAASLAADA
jgi:ADP-heptose:LPS heptosyltransferase